MSTTQDQTPAGEESAETRLLSDATLDRAAMALEYRMRALAPLLREAEDRRNKVLAAALREGAENDLKAFYEIQELRTRLDNANSSAARHQNHMTPDQDQPPAGAVSAEASVRPRISSPGK